MSLPLTLVCLWVLVAALLSLRPSRRQHWPEAWALLALGLPLLAWTWVRDGALAGLLVALAGASVLRWPLRALLRRLGRLARRLPPAR